MINFNRVAKALHLLHDPTAPPCTNKEFDEAEAVLAVSALAMLKADQGTLIRSRWNGDRRIWTLRMDNDVDLADHQRVVVVPVMERTEE